MRHFYNDLSIVLGGAAGQGVQTVEAILVQVLKREGYQVSACKEYMSRVRGGSNSTEIRLSSKKHRAYVRRIDFLFAMDGAVVPHLRSRVSGDTIVFGEKERVKEASALAHFVDTPMTKFANEVGNPIYANTVAVGVILGILGAEEGVFHAYLREFFARKGEDVVGKNIEAAQKGFRFGRNIAYQENIEVGLPRDGKYAKELLLDGNTSLGLGALAGGCDFISSYPMSPGTGVLTFLAQKGVDFGVVVDQAEDEVSAINMALGASYAGARAMVTTSGGGFDLMQEGVSLAGIIETPVVIHIGMRPGPATGLPTRTEQGDLNLALYAGHGEFPRAIFAPGVPEEGISMMRKAFETADKYQIPVFVLSDQHFLDSLSSIPEKAVEKLPIEKHIIETDADYARYRLTDDGISPRGVPGWGEGIVKVDSDEHDETGHITESYEVREKMMEKRMKRLKALAEEAVMPTEMDNFSEAEIAIVSFGSNRTVMEEALRAVNSRKLGGLHFAQVYPINPGVKELLKGKKVVVVENNYRGQFADLLVRELGIKVSKRILKSTGEPFCVEELIKEFKRYD